MTEKKTARLFREGEWFFGLSGRANFLISLVIVLVFCFLDQVIPGSKLIIPNFIKYIAVVCLIYAIASMGINFYSGYLGETSLGHAAFYGIGAYMTGFLTTAMGLDFWLTIPLGMAGAAVAAVPMALAGRRVKGSFMTVITYAFCEIIRYVVINTDELGGSAGIPGIKAPEILGVRITKVPFLPSNKDGYILILYVIVVFIAHFTWKFVHSREGYAVSAIREDAIAAEAMGINVKGYRMKYIIVSAVICSLAGSFYAVFANLVDPNLLSATLSINIFTMLVIGGRRSIKGAILGGFIVVILPEVLRGVQGLAGLSFDPWYILYGLMLIAIMRFRPEGLLGVRE